MDMNFRPSWSEQELSPDGLFGALIRTAVDGIIVIDERGLIQVYNTACTRLFQYSEAEVLGQNVKMLMPAPYRDAHDGYLNHYQQTGEARIVGIGREVRGQRKDGSTFPMYLSVGDGTLHGKRAFVGIVHDLSALYGERETYEAHLIALREELVHVARVSELGQVSAGIAHEINQPLTAMLNYANAAKRLATTGTTEDLEKIRNVLVKVAEQAERAGQIVRRMRDFLEKRASQRGPEDIISIIDDAMALGLIGAKAANVQIGFDVVGTLPPVDVDRVQIQQVLVNVMRNAIDAMEQTERRALSLTVSRQDNGRVEIAIADTGHGIAEGMASQLFTPFVTTKDNGMGIGLAISKSIVEAHGGALSAEPNPGGGTVFRFTVPIKA